MRSTIIISLISLLSVVYAQGSSSSASASIPVAPGIASITNSNSGGILPTPSANITGAVSSAASGLNSFVSSLTANRTGILPLPTGTGNGNGTAISSGVPGLGNSTLSSSESGTGTSSGAGASSTSSKSAANKVVVVGGLSGAVVGIVGALLL